MRKLAIFAVLAAGASACDHDPVTPARPEPEQASLDAPSAFALPDPAGLIAHWDFDQGSGTTLPNVAGPSYPGTFSGTPSWAAGQIGGALSFDGTDYVSIGNIAEANGQTAITLAGWVKRNAAGARVALGKQGSAGANTLTIAAWSDGRVYFGVGGSSWTGGSVQLDDTSWHHVAFVFDGALSGNALRLKGYVDGVQRTLTFGGTIPSTTSASTDPFRVGRIDGVYSNGLVDDVWLFRRVLTPAEVQGLAALTADTVPPSVSLTAPAGGAVLSGIVSVTASASDDVGVVGVQFKLGGANLGAEDLSAPYEVSWNTASASDGPHTLSAVARDQAGNVRTSAPVGVTVSNAPAVSAVFPLSVSSDRRHLLDKNGNPYFINGDSPWELIQNLSLADADLYLTDRKNRGFNAVLITLIEHRFSPNPPKNVYGQGPFTTPGDFATPNPAYFAHVDAVLQKALEREMAVFMTPIYLGYGGGQEGWYAEVNANGPTKLRDFGRYVGNRYRNFPNVVWVMGGDYAPNAALDEIRAFVQGLEETAGPRMFTTHNQRFQSGVTQYPASESWIDLNSTYSSCARAPEHLYDDYNRTWNGGPIPFFLLEGDYEQGNAGGVCYRSQAYWSVLMGGVGHFFGNNPLWNLNMGGNWQQYLNSPVAQDVIHWKNLFASRATALLVPDVTHTVLTAGYGALDGSFAAAARTSDGNTVIVYVPNRRAIQVDMTELSASSAVAWWFNPDTGAAYHIGTVTTTGMRWFMPPTETDWILVIDDAAAGYGPPGS
jgi:hypothetical protein